VSREWVSWGDGEGRGVDGVERGEGSAGEGRNMFFDTSTAVHIPE
jgi:hypothetical protein